MSTLETVFVRFSGCPYPPPGKLQCEVESESPVSPRVAIMVRYLDLLYSVKRRSRVYSFAFYSLRISISLGSLIVPALLSLNQSELLFWIIWILSLFVSISNSFIGIFKIDKKYYILNALYKKLESEGWQFMNLTGNYYSAPEIGHDSQIQAFAYKLEKIIMQQADEEYRKTQEQTQQPANQDTYLPHTLIQKQKSQQEVNAGFLSAQISTQPNKKTPQQEQIPKHPTTTVVEIIKERSVDESTEE
jgi:hypothetical protein